MAQDRLHVSFTYSVPNYIPSHPDHITEIADRLAGLATDDVYGLTWRHNIIGDGGAAIDRSFDRYLAAIAPSTAASSVRSA